MSKDRNIRSCHGINRSLPFFLLLLLLFIFIFFYFTTPCFFAKFLVVLYSLKHWFCLSMLIILNGSTGSVYLYFTLYHFLWILNTKLYFKSNHIYTSEIIEFIFPCVFVWFVCLCYTFVLWLIVLHIHGDTVTKPDYRSHPKNQTTQISGLMEHLLQHNIHYISFTI